MELQREYLVIPAIGQFNTKNYNPAKATHTLWLNHLNNKKITKISVFNHRKYSQILKIKTKIIETLLVKIRAKTKVNKSNKDSQFYLIMDYNK